MNNFTKITKKLFLASGLISAVIFLLPFTMFGILNTGNISGLLFSAVLFCYGAFFDKINKLIKTLWKERLWKFIFSVLVLFVTACIIFVGFATAGMIRAVNNTPQTKTTVIVLGCKVNRDGPSLSLLKRLEAAHEYLTENPDVPCILSGGQGSDEHISEAQAMFDWLTAHGINESRLYIEDFSTSTEENILFSAEIIKREGFPAAITLITNNFHQYRAQKIAERSGIEVYGVSGDTPLYLLPMYYVRELGGIFVELFS